MSAWAEPAASDRRHSSRRVWMLTMALLYPLCALWALTNPMFASPDEPAHIARAQGFSRLDFSEPYETDGLPMTEQQCYAFNAAITAAVTVEIAAATPPARRRKSPITAAEASGRRRTTRACCSIVIGRSEEEPLMVTDQH